MLLEKRTAQHRFAPGVLTPHRTKSRAKQVIVLIQPLDRLQLMADLVRGDKDRICWLGRCVLGALSAPAVPDCALDSAP